MSPIEYVVLPNGGLLKPMDKIKTGECKMALSSLRNSLAHDA